MAIKHWEKDGKTFYQIDVCARSRVNQSIRIQKRESGSIDEIEPDAVRRKLNRIETRLAEDARREVFEREGAGILWSDLVKRWESALQEELEGAKEQDQPSGIVKVLKPSTARGYIQSVNDFTEHWADRPAKEITPADVEDLFKRMTALGYSNCRQYNVKVAISRCFRFGIMKRLVQGVTVSPTYGFGISRKESKRPEILNLSQVDFLISEANRLNHPWRTIWEGAYHTGCRSGELYELRKKNVDLGERRIFLERKYNFVERTDEILKDEEYREVPINDDLHELLLELGVDQMAPEDYVFPRLTAWRNNEAARTLRAFCDQIGIPSICFHTLRACFATHLLQNGVPSSKVLMLGGWSDLETMQRYLRLAGVEVKGSTDSLSRRNRERPARVLKLMPRSS